MTEIKSTHPQPSWRRYLPAGVDATAVTHAIALISDTHTPRRYPDLPLEILSEIFRDTDLILHAGDVGKLWVLDKLSSIAPVVAVHGNDETPEATKELPYQQLLMCGGRRILLWHSHFPNRDEEMAFRREDDSWTRIFQRHVTRAKSAEAEIVIYGHTHIPMTAAVDGRLLINPGAIAGGNLWLRQEPIVALLFLLKNNKEVVQHVMLNRPNHPFDPAVNFELGFKNALYRFQTPFIDPIPSLPHIRQFTDLSKLTPMWHTLCGPYLWGEKKGTLLHLSDWAEQIAKYQGLHPNDQKILLEHIRDQLNSHS